LILHCGGIARNGKDQFPRSLPITQCRDLRLSRQGFIVTDAQYDHFAAVFTERMRALHVGDPMDERTDVGPLATRLVQQQRAQRLQPTVVSTFEVAARGRLALLLGKLWRQGGF
jgi:hypothetical protein